MSRLAAALAIACALAGPARTAEYGGDASIFAAADVVLLGEIHDNGDHHLRQADIVRALRPAAMVFEMLEPGEALALTDEARRDARAIAQATAWDESGWPSIDMYFPIFAAAPHAVIFGDDIARADVRRAVGEGAAAVMGAAAGIFNLDRPLPEDEQARREREQFSAHCDALPEQMLGGMVEAQRLRDAALARAVIAAFEETGGPVVVVTGNGHARKDWGVPALLAVARPDLSVMSLGQFEEAPGEAVPFDVWAISEPADREDPCLAFR